MKNERIKENLQVMMYLVGLVSLTVIVNGIYAAVRGTQDIPASIRLSIISLFLICGGVLRHGLKENRQKNAALEEAVSICWDTLPMYSGIFVGWMAYQSGVGSLVAADLMILMMAGTLNAKQLKNTCKKIRGSRQKG